MSRRARNSQSIEAELEAWETTFAFGHDFFHDLKYRLGLDLSCCQAVQEAAAAAWRRLGASFMTSWEPTPDRPQPWALEQFGDPPA